MRPFRFHAQTASLDKASSGTEMYGYLSLPSQVERPQQGVVLCNPFGQEAVRSHRLYRVLSERLARAGVACLRFDYLGTGDSDGEDEEVTLKTCVENTLRADQVLRREAGCTHVSWLGLRFGAAVAALASLSAQQKPDRLFLWDPVEDGEAWVEQLKREHHLALQALDFWRPGSHPKLAIPAPAKVRLLAQGTRTEAGEVAVFESQGFLVNERLHQEIRALKPETYEAVRCSRLIVIAAGEAQRRSLAGLENARRILSYEMALVAPSQWNSDEAISAAIVPNDVISLVLTEMAGGGQ
jgi:uncharacterized protein